MMKKEIILIAIGLLFIFNFGLNKQMSAFPKNTDPRAALAEIACGKNRTLQAINTPQAGQTAGWTATCTFTPIEGTTITSPIMKVIVNDFGTCSFTWTIKNTSDNSVVSTETYEIAFIEPPQPYAGSTSSICGNSIELTAATSNPPGSVFWSTEENSINFLPNDQIVTTATANFYGTHTIVLTETRDGCTASSTVDITFIKQPAPSFTTLTDEVCGNEYPGLKVETDANATGLWTAYKVEENGSESLLSPPAHFQPSATSPILDYASISNLEAAASFILVKFTWVEKNSTPSLVCEASASKTVKFAKKPLAGVSGSTSPEACNNCIDLTANLPPNSFGNFEWIVTGVNGDFVNDSQNLPNATYCINTPSGFENVGKKAFTAYWTASNPDMPSCQSNAPVNVTLYQVPVANAGFDKAVCGTSFALEGSQSINGSNVTWSTLSQPEGSPTPIANFSNPNQINTSVNVTKTGSWEFVLRENNQSLNACTSKDTVKIEFVAKPAINAGNDFSVCGQETALNATTDNSGGAWSFTSGASFDDASSPTSNVSVNGYGSFVFTWQASNTAISFPEVSCTSSDDVTVSFHPKPVATVYSTPDNKDSVCGLNYSNSTSFSGFQLRGNILSTGVSGYWRTESSGAIFGDNNNGVTSPNTSVSVSSYGIHKFEWVNKIEGSSDVECISVSEPIFVKFIEKPTSEAGDNIVFCGLTGTLAAIAPESGTGIWTSPSLTNLSIQNPSSANSEISSTVYNTETTPHFKLYWTVNNSGCTDTDSVNVTFAPKPESNFEIIPPKCYGESAIIKASDNNLQQYTWNFYGGTIEQAFTNEHGAAHTNLVYWTDGNDIHSISLSSMNNWGCFGNIETKSVEEPKKPEFTVKIIKDTCDLGKGGLEFITEDDKYSFYWATPDAGPAVGSPITIVSNLAAGNYTVKNSYTSFNSTNQNYYTEYITYFNTDKCESNETYNIPKMGIIKPKIEISPEIIIDDLTAPDAKVVFLNKTDYDGIKKRCIWKFGDGTTLNKCDEMIEYTYTKAGCFSPELTIINKELPECAATTKLEPCIRVRDNSQLEIPNIFSPNGDKINDYFQVKAVSLRSFKGTILNRWGSSIYSWENWQDEEAGWDGKINGGSEASAGVYFYVIEAEGLDGAEYKEKGAFHLMK